jgi:hypothetical protein
MLKWMKAIFGATRVREPGKVCTTAYNPATGQDTGRIAKFLQTRARSRAHGAAHASRSTTMDVSLPAACFPGICTGISAPAR